MSAAPLCVGLIGAGANTRSRHIPGLRALPGVEVVAVCNRRRESAQAVGARQVNRQVDSALGDDRAHAVRFAGRCGRGHQTESPVGPDHLRRARDRAQISQSEAGLARDAAQAKFNQSDADRYAELAKAGVVARSQADHVASSSAGFGGPNRRNSTAGAGVAALGAGRSR